jgi:hypothetical protein
MDRSEQIDRLLPWRLGGKMICGPLECGLMNGWGDWVVRMIDGMGLRVDMHGWSEGCVVSPGKQTERVNSKHEQSRLSRAPQLLRSIHSLGCRDEI